MKEKFTKREIIAIVVLIFIQIVVFVIAGMNKQYIHMDEAYSLGLASYDKTEIQDNEDFYNEWHNKEYYEDYLTVNDDEVGKYSQVYENQKNDVHPPLYYLLLRFAMGFHLNSFSKWPGIILNIIIYVFITIFTYLILKKLYEGKEKCSEKAWLITLVSTILFSTITNVLYIRMYALSTLNVVLTTYLHLKLLDSKSTNYKLLLCVGLSALAGSLTHYYYLFYLAMLFIMFVLKYVKEKRYKELIQYVVTICIAGILSLIIFPYSLQHMFFGYRGQGFISKLTDVSQLLLNIMQYIVAINTFGLNNLLYILLVAILGVVAYKKLNKMKIIEVKNKYIKYIALPTLVYFLLVSVASPFVELRYVLPICGMIFIIFIYFIIELFTNREQDIFNKIIISIAILLIAMPILTNKVLSSFDDESDLSILNKYKIEPQEMYSNKKEIVNKIKNEFNVPTIYIFNSDINRFLDDILLFSIIDESYIAKDPEITEEYITNIIKDKDISKGIVVFIGKEQNNEKILETIHNALNLETTTWLEGLNACNVYYMK